MIDWNTLSDNIEKITRSNTAGYKISSSEMVDYIKQNLDEELTTEEIIENFCNLTSDIARTSAKLKLSDISIKAIIYCINDPAINKVVYVWDIYDCSDSTGNKYPISTDTLSKYPLNKCELETEFIQGNLIELGIKHLILCNTRKTIDLSYMGWSKYSAMFHFGVLSDVFQKSNLYYEQYFGYKAIPIKYNLVGLCEQIRKVINNADESDKDEFAAKYFIEIIEHIVKFEVLEEIRNKLEEDKFFERLSTSYKSNIIDTVAKVYMGVVKAYSIDLYKLNKLKTLDKSALTMLDIVSDLIENKNMLIKIDYTTNFSYAGVLKSLDFKIKPNKKLDTLGKVVLWK